MLLQKRPLRVSLHAFGDHIDTQALRHADDGLHDQCISVLDANVAHKALVDLELVQRQAREVGQR
jgi:hypothetical protein